MLEFFCSVYCSKLCLFLRDTNYIWIILKLLTFQGGYMEAKKSKLEKQFREKAADKDNNVKSQIFKGISIFVNGYTCMYSIV